MKKDNGNEILFFIFITMIIVVSTLSFNKYLLSKDYLVFADTECDPLQEQCFTGYCDPESEKCTGTEEDIFFYKQIQRSAHNLDLCDPGSELCKVLLCSSNDSGCSYNLCDPENEEAECSSYED